MNRILVLALLAAWAGTLSGRGQVRLSSLTGTAGYRQDFNGLPANLPASPPAASPFAWTNNGAQTVYGMPGWYVVTTVGSSNAVLAGTQAYVSAAGGNVPGAANVAYGADLAGDRALGFARDVCCGANPGPVRCLGLGGDDGRSAGQLAEGQRLAQAGACG